MVITRHFHTINGTTRITELQSLRDDFNELIHTANKQQKTLKGLVMTDGLTGVSNRRAFEEFIANSWSRMQRSGRSMALIMCDIDFFKLYNDNYGHQAGDEALKAVAGSLKDKICRSSDMVARYGGEEFAIVLADADRENCEAVVHILLDTIRHLNINHHFSQVADHLTASAGAAYVDGSSTTPRSGGYEALIKAADQALYHAKDNGRNQAWMVEFLAANHEISEGEVIV